MSRRLSRTTLFVPASRPDMIPKAAASAADAVCIDLEDAVAPQEKASSRGHVVEALRSLEPRYDVLSVKFVVSTTSVGPSKWPRASPM